jgi:uncharacterized protein (TIGR02444 family)
MRQQKHGKSEVYAEAFWRFSLAFYARPGVAEALLGLQDRAGLDVNRILFAIWQGAVYRHRLKAAELQAVEAAVAPLRREIVEPVRDLRRRLKTQTDEDIQALRRRVAVLELAAERAAQARLAAAVTASAGQMERFAAAEANLALLVGGDARSAEADALRRALQEFLSRG